MLRTAYYARARATVELLPKSDTRYVEKVSSLMNNEAIYFGSVLTAFALGGAGMNQGAFAGSCISLSNTTQGGMGSIIQQGEDDKSVFYTLKVGDQDVSRANANVENGYVSIDAE